MMVDTDNTAQINIAIVSARLTTTVRAVMSEADSARQLAYIMAATPFGTVTENVQKQVPNSAWSPDQLDPNDPPEFIEVQEWVTRPATPEEAAIGYSQWVINDLSAKAFAWDQQRAAAAAAAEVPPITPIKPPGPVPGE